ncbi:DUF4865 family protein [Alloalcanivorax gelatiniphagus]
MFAMHYDIRLPADYDMEVIRTRVRERGHALDDREGLGLKAYLTRDLARGGEVSSYSPFYLWTDEAAAGRFLWGGEGFAGIVRDFGRPPVQTWVGGEFLRGPAHDERPVLAGIASTRVATALDPVRAARAAADRARETTSGTHVHSTAWMIDPQRWEITHLVLADHEDGLEDVRTDAGGDVFEVLHLSAPEMAALS